MRQTFLGHLYLPPVTSINLYHLREVLAGRKKVLGLDKVIALIVPQLPEFTVARALEMIEQDDGVMEYIPTKRSKAASLTASTFTTYFVPSVQTS